MLISLFRQRLGEGNSEVKMPTALWDSLVLAKARRRPLRKITNRCLAVESLETKARPTPKKGGWRQEEHPAVKIPCHTQLYVCVGGGDTGTWPLEKEDTDPRPGLK